MGGGIRAKNTPLPTTDPGGALLGHPKFAATGVYSLGSVINATFTNSLRPPNTLWGELLMQLFRTHKEPPKCTFRHDLLFLHFFNNLFLIATPHAVFGVPVRVHVRVHLSLPLLLPPLPPPSLSLTIWGGHLRSRGRGEGGHLP